MAWDGDDVLFKGRVVGRHSNIKNDPHDGKRTFNNYRKRINYHKEQTKR